MKVELVELVDELSDDNIEPRGRRETLHKEGNILGSVSSSTLICPTYGMGSLSSFLERKSNDLMKCLQL